MTRPARPATPAATRFAGFTLVELLVAIFIAAIMFVIGYRTIDRGLVDREAVKAKEDRIIAMQNALRMMEQDFSQLAPRPVRDPGGNGYLPAFLVAKSSSGNDAPSGLSSSQPSSFASITQISGGNASDMLQFTRGGWANPAGIQRPALERVTYAFENGVIKRRHYPVLDTVLAEQPITRDLLDHVKSVKFRFMATGGRGQWIDQWQNPVGDPAADHARGRPIAIEVTVELEDYGKILRIIEVPG